MTLTAAVSSTATLRKVAIITGSGTGVGAATALMLAAKGYNVLINYSRSEAEALATQVTCTQAGADTLELNLEASAGTPMFAEHRHGPASQLVPAWVAEVLGA